jgi:hypothetical protein
MRTIGVYLIYAAVVLRGVVVYGGAPQLALVAILLAVYGLLLFAETWIPERGRSRLPWASGRAVPGNPDVLAKNKLCHPERGEGSPLSLGGDASLLLSVT